MKCCRIPFFPNKVLKEKDFASLIPEKSMTSANWICDVFGFFELSTTSYRCWKKKSLIINHKLKRDTYKRWCDVLINMWITFWISFAKGQLILKGVFGFYNSSKKQTKNFYPSRLGQKLEFSSSFFGRIEDTNISFQD